MSERILAVDDDPGMRRVLERTLGSVYDVELASNVADARSSLMTGRFDVALVDVRLGDGDGYALCAEIRRGSPETDVILITGSTSEPDEKLFRALEEGAFYFLFKPFERRVLRALVDRCLELQRARRAKDEFARELADDLERARRFQTSLVPREPLHRGGWYVEGRFQPCDALGGDFYVSLAGPDESVIVALSDIVGHGVRAAMYAGMLRSLLDTARRRNPDPQAVQRELLSGIDFFESESYASLVYAQLGRDGKVRYFNAGHPPPLCLRASGDIESLDSTGLILTPLLPRDGAKLDDILMHDRERLLIFSDGMYEVLDPNDQEWGVEGLSQAFSETRTTNPSDALDQIMDRLKRHAGGRPLDDDATVILVERTVRNST